MRRFVTASVVISASLIQLGCGRHQETNSAATSPSATSRPSTDESPEAVLSSYMDIGENRPYTASGPEFSLPDRYYEYARTNPKLAISMIRGRLRSPEANIRCNAYDFARHLLSVKEVNVDVRTILRDALKNEGFAIQQFLKPIEPEL